MTPGIATIEVICPCAAWRRACPEAKELARTGAALALARGMAAVGIASEKAIELSITLSDDDGARRLNRRWRGVDRSTNVLAFPAWAPGASLPAEIPLLLGDVVLAFETVAREAEEQGKQFADHFFHLVVHGVLHLLGYDHHTEGDAVAMEALETSILENFGVADPYQLTM